MQKLQNYVINSIPEIILFSLDVTIDIRDWRVLCLTGQILDM